MTETVTQRPTLRNGSRGAAVVELQDRLNLHQAADPPLAADGIFGPKTLQAVQWFQAAHALDVDGIVGPKTWNALLQDPPAPEPAPQPAPQPETHPFQPGQPAQPAAPPPAKPKPGIRIPVPRPSAPPATTTPAAVHVGRRAAAFFRKALDPKTKRAPGDGLEAEFATVLGVPARVQPLALVPPIVPGDPNSLLAALGAIVGAMTVLRAQGRTTPEENDAFVGAAVSLWGVHGLAALRPASQRPNLKRQEVVAVALTQVGAMDDRRKDGDAPGGFLRFGRAGLLEYFETAAGPNLTAAHRARIQVIPRGAFTGDTYTGKGDDLPDWCSIFALWAYRSAGIKTGDWQFGPGFMESAKLPPPIAAAKVRPGDIGVAKGGNNHTYIVAEILPADGGKPRVAITVEGNTGFGGGSQGGKVAVHVGKRPLDATSFWFTAPELTALD